MDREIECLIPDWPAPPGVKSAVSLRRGGVSEAPFEELNIALHVGDNPVHVERNRKQLSKKLNLPSEPLWLEQVHGTDIVATPADTLSKRVTPKADGSFTQQFGEVCAVMTADCLPVLMCNLAGTSVAAVHAGWRGLSAGILRKAVALFGSEPGQIMVYLGPAIGPNKFEVGEDVIEAFTASAISDEHATQMKSAFLQSPELQGSETGKYLANLYQLATLELNALGVSRIYGGNACTYSDPELFYSFRRESITGRNASLIWLE